MVPVTRGLSGVLSGIPPSKSHSFERTMVMRSCHCAVEWMDASSASRLFLAWFISAVR